MHNFIPHGQDRIHTVTDRTMLFYFMLIFFEQKGHFTSVKPALAKVEIRKSCGLQVPIC